MSRNKDQSDSGESATFVGEEEVSEPVTATQNLIAAVVIAAIAILAMILSVRLEIPGRLVAAPGLLPFIVGFSLLLMAVGLGLLALRDGALRGLRGAFPSLGEWLGDEERRRTLLLLFIIVVYVVLVDRVAFEWRLPFGGFDLRFSGYELFSTIALTVILRIFWRRPILPHCLGISLAMVLALAAVFRYGFRILLPGLG